MMSHEETSHINDDVICSVSEWKIVILINILQCIKCQFVFGVGIHAVDKKIGFYVPIVQILE